MNNAMNWIDSIRGNDSHREVARKIGTTHSTLTRQVNQDQVTFETVRAVARAYGRPVVAELIATGHLTPEDAGAEGLERALQTATDEQLVVEVGRRLNVTQISGLWDAPISEAVQTAATVSHLADHRRDEVPTNQEDLPAVAKTRSRTIEVNEEDYP
ncbi:hypothetical protein [Lysinibacter cavernae]|uniref:Uncharacterized protein n=1 Tax=Lysinibacter cavernae TaxID=1640652 RepID=A0A7X5QYX8_9MICO|nr:hypothetical protein [Lysinibacter cavernae]NIH52511.1 hypothetical protein [Lysinibacter cavernae]